LLILTAPSSTPTYTHYLHDALPISGAQLLGNPPAIDDTAKGFHQVFQVLLEIPDAVVGGIHHLAHLQIPSPIVPGRHLGVDAFTDRKSTRLNSSHVKISYAVFCLKK